MFDEVEKQKYIENIQQPCRTLQLESKHLQNEDLNFLKVESVEKMKVRRMLC